MVYPRQVNLKENLLKTPQTGVKETYLTSISKSADRQSNGEPRENLGRKDKSDTRLLTKVGETKN